jgi:hypothetical protein
MTESVLCRGWGRLMSRMGTRRLIVAAMAVMFFLALPLSVAEMAERTQTIPTISIVAVQRDTNVTVRTANFPANRDFTVRMGPMGSQGVNGHVGETFSSGSGGTIERTFTIPAALHGTGQIAIRLESTTGGYFAYNWFYNSSAAAPTPAPTSVVTPAPTATPQPSANYPWFSIAAVVRDQSVTIDAYNLPANRDFIVRMGPMGSRAENGTIVATTASGAGGSLTATYQIPEGLRGAPLIAIRMDSSGGYFAYNWFYNTTTR